MRVSGMITAGLAVLALAAGSALAQEDEAEGCSVCEFDAETIVGSTTHYREFPDRMAAAEAPLREYPQDSLTSIEMGSRPAVRDFSPRYRHRIEQQNAEALQ